MPCHAKALSGRLLQALTRSFYRWALRQLYQTVGLKKTVIMSYRILLLRLFIYT